MEQKNSVSDRERAAAANWCGVDHPYTNPYEVVIPKKREIREPWRKPVHVPFYWRDEPMYFILSVGIMFWGGGFVLAAAVAFLTSPFWLLKILLHG
jgi:hypothetical protein